MLLLFPTNSNTLAFFSGTSRCSGCFCNLNFYNLPNIIFFWIIAILRIGSTAFMGCALTVTSDIISLRLYGSARCVIVINCVNSRIRTRYAAIAAAFAALWLTRSVASLAFSSCAVKIGIEIATRTPLRHVFVTCSILLRAPVHRL